MTTLDPAHEQRRCDFRGNMQQFSGELEWLDPEFKIPEESTRGSFNGLNLRSDIDVQCANLAEWITGKLVDWSMEHIGNFNGVIDREEIFQLLNPGMLAIAETHASIPLLNEDMETSSWTNIGIGSTEFTSKYAKGGTSAFYAIRRWLGLRKTLANVFEYDPVKLTVESDKIDFASQHQDPIDEAVKASKASGRPQLACVALQAVVDKDTSLTMFDAVSHAYTRGASDLIYPKITSDDIKSAREKSELIRKADLPGENIAQQMSSAIKEMF